MALQPLPARDMIVQVLQADGVTWTELEGITACDIDLSAGEVFTDKTSYANAGNQSQLKMQAGAALAITYQKWVDTITGAQAPGQARVQSLADTVGWANLGQVRFREELSTQWTHWTEATHSAGAQTGGVNDLRTGTYTLGRNGASSLAAVA